MQPFLTAFYKLFGSTAILLPKIIRLKTVKHFVYSGKSSTFAMSKGKDKTLFGNIKTLQGIGQLFQEL